MAALRNVMSHSDRIKVIGSWHTNDSQVPHAHFRSHSRAHSRADLKSDQTQVPNSHVVVTQEEGVFVSGKPRKLPNRPIDVLPRPLERPCSTGSREEPSRCIIHAPVNKPHVSPRDPRPSNEPGGAASP